VKRYKAFFALIVLVSGGTGCSHGSDAPPPPSPNAFLKHVQDNPNMPADQKAAMMQTIRSHQGSGQLAGEARQKRVSTH
jgi:hypothetical protein